MTHIRHTPATGTQFVPGWTSPEITDSEIALHLYLADCSAAPLLLLKEWAGEHCPWGTLPSNRKLSAQIDAARRTARRTQQIRQQVAA